jgi:hypothetical protein
MVKGSFEAETSEVAPHLDRAKIGRHLIIAAWAIEILAATIGVLIAVLVIIKTQHTIGKTTTNGEDFASGMMAAFLGGLPFIMVAAVELTKIPLATACYHARSKLWQITLLLGLIFLMVITFETILNGFERNFTQRTYVIKQQKKKLIAAEEALEKTENDILQFSSITRDTIRSEYEAEIQQIDQNRTKELTELDRQIQQARITYSGRDAEAIRSKRDQIGVEIRKLDTNFETERARIETDFSNQYGQSSEAVQSKRTTLERRVDSTREDLVQSRSAEQRELSAIKDEKGNAESLEREVSRIQQDFENRERTAQSNFETRRDGLEKELESAAANLNELTETREATIKSEDADSPLTPHEQIVKEVTERFSERIDTAESNFTRLQNESSTLSVASELQAILRQKDVAITNAKKAFQDQNSKGARERATVREKYTQARGKKEEQLERLLKQLTNLSLQSLGAELTAKRDAILSKQKSDYESSRSELVRNREDLSQKLANALKATEDILQPVIEGLQERRSGTVGRYDDLRKTALQRHSRSQEEQITREGQTAQMREIVRELSGERLAIRDNIGKLAEDSQIYRVAALWTGKDSPADVSNKELRLISLIWFGSLAAITAWTGILLAFGGLAVRYGRRNRDGLNLRKAVHSIRRYFVTRRRVRMKPREVVVEKIVEKPVEVIKEVPVDKIVFRDVPKEVVRKELVYVPFFTDDPEYLDGQTSVDRAKIDGATSKNTRAKKPRASRKKKETPSVANERLSVEQEVQEELPEVTQAENDSGQSI